MNLPPQDDRNPGRNPAGGTNRDLHDDPNQDTASTAAGSGSRPAIFLGVLLVLILGVSVAAISLAGSDDDEARLVTEPGADAASVDTAPLDTEPADTELVTEPADTQPDTGLADTEPDTGPADTEPATEPADTEPATAPADTGPVETTPQTTQPPARASAVYEVTMEINWTDETHPGTLPNNAHVSPPILAVHRTPGAMFALGTLASPGIEDMAERGTTEPLVTELRDSGDATDVQTQPDIPFPAVGTRTFQVTVTQDAHLISLVTMLAPSPDWFVGVADQATFVDGQWIESLSFPMGNYDSGTDSGPDFRSDNADTQPAAPISGPVDPAFAEAAGQAPFGTLTITRVG